MTETPAGWFDVGQGYLRWWDGTAWTDAMQPIAPPLATAPAAAPQAVQYEVTDVAVTVTETTYAGYVTSEPAVPAPAVTATTAAPSASGGGGPVGQVVGSIADLVRAAVTRTPAGASPYSDLYGPAPSSIPAADAATAAGLDPAPGSRRREG